MRKANLTECRWWARRRRRMVLHASDATGEHACSELIAEAAFTATVTAGRDRLPVRKRGTRRASRDNVPRTSGSVALNEASFSGVPNDLQFASR